MDRRLVATLVLILALAQGGRACDAADIGAPVRVLDVSYMPQTETLGGGAALAMVFRYWGDAAANANEFARLAGHEGEGIEADSLVAVVRARKWSAFPMVAKSENVQDHLSRGRPVVALIDAGSKVRHFVVLLAWANGSVILHDPAVGPFRAVSERDFDRDWGVSGRWALLVLPPEEIKPPAAPGSTARAQTPGSDAAAPAPPPPDTTSLDTPVIPEIAGSGAVITGCDGMVSEGVRRAKAGATAEAEGLFSTAATYCPTSAAPMRELAGLRFRAKDYRAAGDLAQQALSRESSDASTWKLLAGSRYMEGDTRNALEAWNHVKEPRADLTHVDGLHRIGSGVVADQIDLPTGDLLSWEEYRRANRRLDEIPAASEAHLDLKPLPDGSAQVNVVVKERPLLFDDPMDVGITAVRAAATEEAVIHLSSPLRLGELWTARWRFRVHRPRVLGALDIPALTGRPGIWHVEGFWERQAYASVDAPKPNVDLREGRMRGALSFADWIGPDWRLELGGAFDRFDDAQDPAPRNWKGFFSLDGSIEARSVGEHLSFALSGAGWTKSGERPFREGEFLTRFGSDDYSSGDWIARAGFSAASERSPLAIWPGAGSGTGRGALLRAHPLLDHGIINGLVFGRRMAHGGVERRVWPWSLKKVRIGLAAFLDVGKAWRPLIPRDVPWQFDVGGGIRIARGKHSELRADYGYGLEDGESAVSVGLEAH